MKHIVKEEINYKVEKTKNGTPIAYIDPQSSDNIYDFKDIIKKHGGKWDSYSKRWFWWLSKDESETENILNNKVNPAIDELTHLETPKNGVRRNSDDIKSKIAKMVKEIDTILAAPTEKTSNSVSESDIKSKVASFKEKIVNITSSEEFKALMGPIIKFKQALGHSYSFGNTILIWVQDPKATMVKSKSRWAKVNRRVVEGSPAIFLYSPAFMEPYTPQEKEEIKNNYLKKWGVDSVKDLNPGQKEILSVKLNGSKPKSFVLTPSFYDHRFTEVIEGKEDLAPKGDSSDIEWFDDKTPASEKTAALYDSAIVSIQETGIKINFVEDLNGARGVSKSGVIEVLKNSKKNIGDFNTLVHEFSHELLHQTYLKNRSKNEYSSFFVGRNEGRAMVEQQAELSAWIICQYFGYEMPTSVNYMGCWGMDNKSAARVFDTVAHTSSYIIELLTKNMNGGTIKESIDKQNIITGEEIANLVGLGELYRKSKKMEKNTFNESKLRQMVRNVLKEAFSDIVEWNHFNNDADDEEYLQDAIEAIEMSDNAIDFYEWYDGFRDEIEPDYAQKIWKKAQKQCGYITESKEYPNENYTHFAVNKKTNLIVNGWDYNGYDSEELKQFKKDYFIQDLIDYDFNPKDYKILTKQGCLKQGINPDDIQNCWSNRGEIPCKDE